MQLNPLDSFFENLDPENKSCLLALKDYILHNHKELDLTWKYRLPFFVYKSKMCIYLWIEKKSNQPYIGVVHGAKLDYLALEQGSRAKMKILRLNPSEDFPIELISDIINESIKIIKS